MGGPRMAEAAAAQSGVRAALATLADFMPPRRRRQAIRLALLMPIVAFAEMASIASIVPLLAFLAGESGRQKLPWLTDILGKAAAWLDASLVTVAGALFMIAALAAAAIRLWLARSSQRFAYGLGHEVSVEVQRRVLHQPYQFHVGHH